MEKFNDKISEYFYLVIASARVVPLVNKQNIRILPFDWGPML